MDLTLRYAVIVAGGSGSRMASDIPKQFLVLNGLPVLMHTIAQFSKANCEEIIVVLPKLQIAYWEELCKQYQFAILHQVVEGGSTRFNSVKNGLLAFNQTAGLVAIHDGVRPCIKLETIEAGYNQAKKLGSAIAAVKPKDSLRLQEGENTVGVDRSKYYCIQTPQVFHLSKIIEAYHIAKSNDFTDDATVFEAAGNQINLYEGDYRNIKITTPEDLLVASVLLSN